VKSPGGLLKNKNLKGSADGFTIVRDRETIRDNHGSLEIGSRRISVIQSHSPVPVA